MPHSAASDLDLHCLPMSLLWDARHKWVKNNSEHEKKQILPKNYTPSPITLKVLITTAADDIVSCIFFRGKKARHFI